ncbi:hypothetical protein [Fimbriimonas ginsengisoli]|uniref:Hemagglutinin protein n=1 Tax=Fimbriimonas ginsengisoli Gsoil 348 TaxID=661478 RepID=A0A068NIH1_FIMGI|nr:hypothetical protein [Fimbriimonas ginsengisoli]AIE83408.1 hemagglutinin protein [Fimbriimonas ginsengisoli Gsoil 348]
MNPRSVKFARHLLALFSLLFASAIASAQALPKVLWHSDGWLTTQALGYLAPLRTSFSRDGSRMLIWNNVGFAVYNSSNGALVSYVAFQLHAYGIGISTACISNDGLKVYYQMPGENVAIHDVATQTQTNVEISGVSLTGLTAYTMCLSEDGSTLGFTTQSNGPAGHVNTVYLYDLNGKKLINRFPVQVPGQTAFTRSMSFFGGGKKLALDGPTVYDLSGKQLGSINNVGAPCLVSPDQKILYVYNAGYYEAYGTLSAYNSTTLAPLWSVKTPSYHSAAAASADGKAVFIGAATLGHWGVVGYSSKDGQALPHGYDYPMPTQSGQDAPALVLSPVGTTAATALIGPGTQESQARVVKLDTTSGLGTLAYNLFEGSSKTSQYAVTTASGPMLVSDDWHSLANTNPGTWATTLRSAATGLPALSIPAIAALVSPNAQYYISKSSSFIQVYQVGTDKLLATLYPPTGSYIYYVGWGPKSDQLYVLTSDTAGSKISLLIEAFNGSKFTLTTSIPSSNSKGLTGIAGGFSSDGKRLAMLNMDGKATIQIFDTTNGALTGTIKADVSSRGILRFDSARTSQTGPSLLGIFEVIGGSAPVNEYRVYDISAVPKIVSAMTYPITYYVSGSPYDGTISPDGKYVAMGDLARYAYGDSRRMVSIHLFRGSDGTPLGTWTGMPGGQPHLCFSSDTSVLSYQNISPPDIYSTTGLFTLSLPPSGFVQVLKPAAVFGGTSSVATLTFDRAMPEATPVSLHSSSPSATVLASIVVPAGATSATFTVTTLPVSASTTAQISSSLGSLSATTTLTINPANALTLTVNPTSVKGGVASIGTVTLNAPAGPSGVVVKLTSRNTKVANPKVATITVAAGKTTATFSIATIVPTADTNVIIDAAAPTFAGSATLTVTK